MWMASSTDLLWRRRGQLVEAEAATAGADAGLAGVLAVEVLSAEDDAEPAGTVLELRESVR